MSNNLQVTPSIVVIDDTPANLRLLAGMLMKEGYRVRPMPGGELGLKTVRAAPPDLILLDINMPDIDGYEVCRRLKADPHTRYVPVIFISALGETLDKVKAFNVGGVDYITKPFHVEEVQARIRTQLDLKFSRDHLERANKDLTSSLNEKNEFISVLVNELKNPLNVLTGYSEMLSEDAGHMEAVDISGVANRITDTSKRMHELVVKILEVNMMELNAGALEMKEVDINAVIAGVMGNLERTAEEKGIGLFYHSDDMVPLLSAHEGSVYRIVENLVGNALKFSSRGDRIDINVTHREGWCYCMVADTGPGFTDEDLPRTFVKYARLSAKPTGGESSTGLGLCVVKTLVEAHGGQVHLKTTPGKGSVFTFDIPLMSQKQ